MSRVTNFRRDGDRMWRPPTPNSQSLGQLLTHLSVRGFEGAPKFLSLDSDGAMCVSWIDGWAPEERETWSLETDALESVGRLLRSYHEAVADFVPTGGFEEGPSAVKAGTIVCHGDISPRNTVFRDGRAVALIDWDGIWIADPLWDLGHAIWQFAPICRDDDPWLEDCPTAPDRQERIRALARGYGADANAGQAIARMVVEVIAGCRRSVERKAAAGSHPFMRMVEEGMLTTLEHQLKAAHSLGPLVASAVRDADSQRSD